MMCARRLPEGVEAVASLAAALEAVARHSEVERLFVIGGAQLYREALDHPAHASLSSFPLSLSFPRPRLLPLPHSPSPPLILLCLSLTPSLRLALTGVWA